MPVALGRVVVVEQRLSKGVEAGKRSRSRQKKADGGFDTVKSAAPARVSSGELSQRRLFQVSLRQPGR